MQVSAFDRWLDEVDQESSWKFAKVQNLDDARLRGLGLMQLLINGLRSCSYPSNQASSSDYIWLIEYNHHQPSLAKKIFFSSSFRSELKSLMATDEHFLFLVTLPFLSSLQMPNHSPRVSPCSISQTGTLFWAASPFTILTQLASVQFLANSTYLALTFSSLLSRDLATSWIPLARRESALEVWMILLRAVSKSTAWISVVISMWTKITNYYLINQYSFLLKLNPEPLPEQSKKNKPLILGELPIVTLFESKRYLLSSQSCLLFR